MFHLFDVQKVFSFKVYGGPLDWTILVKCPAITHVGFYCKRHWFRLLEDNEE